MKGYQAIMPDKHYKYGVFRKGSWKPIILTETKEEAEKLRKYNYSECEVRPLWID